MKIIYASVDYSVVGLSVMSLSFVNNRFQSEINEHQTTNAFKIEKESACGKYVCSILEMCVKFGRDKTLSFWYFSL